MDEIRKRGRHLVQYFCQCIGPREDKIEKVIYPTKVTFDWVSENTAKSFVTRSVTDKRSTSSYRTSEKVQSVKSRDLPGYSGNDAARDHISSFYSSYSKGEDLSDAAKADQLVNKSEDVISSFYQSSVGLRKDRSVDRRTKIDEEIGGSTRATSYKASAAELHAARGVSWRTDKSTEPYDSLKRRSSLLSLKKQRRKMVILRPSLRKI